MGKQIFVWCAVAAVWATVAIGQEPTPLVTDRPDQTESSVVVPPGTVQVEIGWLRTDDGADRDVEGPGTLVRWGLGERWELRLGWDGWIDRNPAVGPSSRGAGDGAVGVKVAMAPERGRRPETALLVSTTLPVGDDSVSGDRSDPSFRFLFSHTLPADWGLGYNLGGALNDDDLAAEYTVALGRPLSPRWGVFGELFGELPVDGPGDDAHSFDAGVTLGLGSRLQLDASAAFGLSGAAPNRFVGVGLSFRVPR